MSKYIFSNPFSRIARIIFGYFSTTNGKTRDFTSEYLRVFPGVYKRTHVGRDLQALYRLKRMRNNK